MVDEVESGMGGALRFGFVTRGVESGRALASLARRVEGAGYATMLFPDHLGLPSPLTSAAVAAAATTSLRVGTMVLNNDFRHAGLLAQEAATVDALSGGRLELGLGAGYQRSEYDAIGLDYDAAGARIARLDETATVLRGLFAGDTVTFAGDHVRISDHTLEPLPPQGAGLPLLIGGNGDRLLTVAAHRADIVGLTGFSAGRDGGGPSLSHFSAERAAERIAFVREAAGERADDIEFQALVQQVTVTDDPRAVAAELEMVRGGMVALEDVLGSPFVLLGPVTAIADRIRTLRDEFGITYVTVFEGRSDGFGAVVEQLAGQ